MRGVSSCISILACCLQSSPIRALVLDQPSHSQPTACRKDAHCYSAELKGIGISQSASFGRQEAQDLMSRVNIFVPSSFGRGYLTSLLLLLKALHTWRCQTIRFQVFSRLDGVRGVVVRTRGKMAFLSMVSMFQVRKHGIHFSHSIGRLTEKADYDVSAAHDGEYA